ncbi:MAG: hypothetical protein KY444_10825 [Gemmatimonadetes bacterium]|nr:hypothetical protein [Gemmatimonadota bacterium]
MSDRSWRGLRRDRAGARVRHQRWHEDASYRQILPLARAQRQLDAAHFERLSPFLDQPAWEATNNGAERTARLFRHRQAPDFTLRTQTAVDDLLKGSAFLRKDEVTNTAGAQAARSFRGRPARTHTLPRAA